MFNIKKMALFFISSLLSLYVSKSIAEEIVNDNQPVVLIKENQEKNGTGQNDETNEDDNDEEQEDDFDDEEYNEFENKNDDTLFGVDQSLTEVVAVVPGDETLVVESNHHSEAIFLENDFPVDQISAVEIVVSTEESHQTHDEHTVDEDEDFDFEDDYSFEEKTEEEDDERKQGTSIKIQPRKPVVLTWKNTVALVFASIKDIYTEWSNFLYKKFSVVARYKKNIKK